MLTSQFSKGQPVVGVNHDEPVMTVADFNFFRGTVICDWWTRQGAPQQKEFLPELLRPAPANAGAAKRASKRRLVRVSR